MKEEFNLVQVLSQLAKALNDNNYRDGFTTPVKQLLKKSDDPEIADVVKSALEIAFGRAGEQGTMSMLYGLMNELKKPETRGTQDMLAWLGQQWETALDKGIARDVVNTRHNLTTFVRAMPDDHPFLPTMVSRWSKLIGEQLPQMDAYELNSTFSLTEIKSNAFRKEVFAKLDAMKDENPLLVLKQLTDLNERSSFITFKDNDPASFKSMLALMLYMAESGKLPAETVEDYAWKALAYGADADAALARKGADIYLGIAGKKEDKAKAFDMYRGAMRYKNLPGLQAEATEKILALAEAGEPKKPRNGPEEAARIVWEEIFYPATQPETKNDAVAARAADIMYKDVAKALADKRNSSPYLYLNMAFALKAYLPVDDPRSVEVVKLWKESTVTHFKSQDYQLQTYTNQTGWMLDAATKQGDTELADYARKEWQETIERIAQKNPRQAHKIITDIIAYASRDNPQSALLKEAQALLPSLTERAGIIKTPDEVSLADIRKLIAAKKQQARPAA